MRRKGPLIQLAVVALLLVASPNAAGQDITVTAPEIDRVGQMLMATPGGWQPPEAASSPKYQWSRCNPSGESCEDISGATVPSLYMIPDEDSRRSFRIRLTVTPIAGGNELSATSEPTPAPPSNTTRPAISGVPLEGQVSTAWPGEWHGTPRPSFDYQWERCNPSGHECKPIKDAASTTYALTAADVWNTLRVVVTATNGVPESRSAISRPTSVVERAPPLNAGPPTIVGVAEFERSLTATPGQWVTSGPIEFLYRWLRCNRDGSGCDPIPGANSATYQVRLLDVGSRLRVRVTAISDGGSLTRDSTPTVLVPAPAGVLAFTQSGPAAPAPIAALMRPFPRVRIKGYYTPSGAVLQLLTIKGAAGARIAAACRGRGCPYRHRSRRGRQRVRLRALEGSYRAGARLTIRVTKPALIGKYTRIVIRANRAPKRRDRCLMPASRRPVECPPAG